MATITERLAFLITANPNDAIKAFNDTAKAADKELGKAEERIDKLAAGLTKAGATMLALGGAAAAGLVVAAGKAGDLAEAVNLTEITFGDAADQIDAFAATAADSLGQSERAAREATASFGGLLQNLGFTNDQAADTSIQLTKLASDLGSAFNTEPAEAVQALGSALRGETEPIRRYNVLLTDQAVRQRAVEMGLADTTAEVDANGKAQATLALILEQTNRYQGDFANTSDSAANAQRRLNAQWEDTQAQLGEAVLPIMQSALGVANDLVGGFNRLNTATGGALTTVATFGTGLLLAGGAISTVAGKVIDMRDGLRALAGRFGSARVAAAGFGAAIAGLALQQFLSRMAESNAEIKAQRDAFYDALAAGEDYVAFLRLGVNENDQLREIVRRTGISLGDLDKALRGTDEEYQEFRDGVLETIAAQERSATVSDDVNQRLQQEVRMSREEMDRLRDSHLYAAESVELTAESFSGFAKEGVIARDIMAELGDATDDTTEDTEELRTAWELLLGAIDRNEAFDNARRAMEEAFLAMFLGAEDSERKVYDVIEALERIPGVADQVRNHPLLLEIQLAVEQGDLDEALRKARNLESLMRVIGGESSPGTNFTPPPMGPDLSWINDFDWSFLPAAEAQPRAAGGPVMAGRTYLVGERGPELLTMGGSGFVTPNHALGGSNYSITVNAGLGADGALIGQQIVEEIRRFERRNGSGWRS